MLRYSIGGDEIFGSLLREKVMLEGNGKSTIWKRGNVVSPTVRNIWVTVALDWNQREGSEEDQRLLSSHPRKASADGE